MRLALELIEEALLLQLKKKMFYRVAGKNIPLFHLNGINKSLICGINRLLVASLDIPFLGGICPCLEFPSKSHHEAKIATCI